MLKPAAERLNTPSAVVAWGHVSMGVTMLKHTTHVTTAEAQGVHVTAIKSMSTRIGGEGLLMDGPRTPTINEHSHDVTWSAGGSSSPSQRNSTDRACSV